MPVDSAGQSLSALRQHLLDPFPWYRRMRRVQPVSYVPERDTWQVFRYDDVARVLSDSAAFSSHFRGRKPGHLFAETLIDTDPPRHRQLRALVNQAFLPRAVEALAPRIRAIAHDLLDRVLPAGRMDAIHDLACPLPALVIAELLGIPPTDWETLKRWSDMVVSLSAVAYGPAYREMTAYFTDAIERYRLRDGDNLVGRLLAARVEGCELRPAEVVDFCSLLLISGHETTAHVIGNAVLCLTDHPEVWERLRGEPALLPQAIEEVLRNRPPVRYMPRVAAVETTLGGQTIRPGSSVIAWIGSANHDEAQFRDPERFDVDRVPNPHIAFGRGVHYCLGASLARLEVTAVLTALLERVRSLARIPGVRLEPFPSTVIHGVRRLPVTLTV
jgi:cytochrome P450